MRVNIVSERNITPFLIRIRKSELLNYLDRFALLIILSLAILPVSRLPIGVNRGTNIEAPLQIVLLILLIFRAIINGVSLNSFPIFLFLSICLIYSVVALMFQIPIVLVFNHVKNFFPFLLACLIISVGSDLRIEPVIKWFVIATGISGILMLYLQYVNPQLLLFAYADRYEEYLGLIRWGRAFWLNYPSTLLVLIFLFNTEIIERKWRTVVYLFSILGFIGLLASFNRTNILGAVILAFFLGINLILRKRINRIASILFFFFLFVIAAWLFVQQDKRLLALLQGRIFNLLMGTANITGSVDTRMILLEQYRDRFLVNPILGQGLGVPYSIIPTTAFWSDTTLVSFILPFGIFGLLIFVGYIFTIFKMLLKSRVELYRALSNGFILLMGVELLISLNDDIWSHKSFVIFFSYFVTILYYSAIKRMQTR